MFKYLYNKLFPTKVLPNKDPNDFTLTKSSTPWSELIFYFCSNCDTDLNVCKYEKHGPYIPEFCTCGTHKSFFHKLTYTKRKIIKNNKWIIQYRHVEKKS